MSGYDQFFKKARKVAAEGRPAKPLAEKLREKIKPKIKKKPVVAWKLAGLSFVGLVVAAMGLSYSHQIEKLLKKVEISVLGFAVAEDAPAKAKPASAPVPEGAPEKSKGVPLYTEEQVDHFAKLNERKRELDAREEELNRMETELQAQREQLEKRMGDLEQTRRSISSTLDDKVKADDKKVDTLVQVYSNMKPQQAAKVFEQMDEDLAVEILGRMKKKNAAEIMNLIKPEKTQVFSERYAGYKKKQ